MTHFHGLDANEAIAAYMAEHGAALPAATREEIDACLAAHNGLGEIIGTIDALHAVHQQLDPDGVALLHDLAGFVHEHNFYGRRADGSAARMQADAAALITLDPAALQ